MSSRCLVLVAATLVGACGPEAPAEDASDASPRSTTEAVATVSATASSAPAVDSAAPVASAAPSDTAPAVFDISMVVPMYAPLFELGRTFEYTALTEESRYDPEDKKADKGGNVSKKGTKNLKCSVTAVGDVPGGRFATLDCGKDGNDSLVPPLGGATPAGHYVATPKGLHHVQFGGDPKDVDNRQFLIARTPQPTSKTDKQEDGETTTVVKKNADGAWCAEESFVFGDGGFNSTCFLEGKGVVSGERTFDGGMHASVTWTLKSTKAPKTK